MVSLDYIKAFDNTENEWDSMTKKIIKHGHICMTENGCVVEVVIND